MRTLAVAAMCAGALVACAGTEPPRQASRDFRRLGVDFDQAWEGAIRVLSDRGFEIRKIDRTTGVIETGWLSINPEYAATIFMTEQEDRYSTCGRPLLGQAFHAKQARLVLTLSPIRRGDTGLRAEAFFRTQRYLEAPIWFSQLLGDEDCGSRGRLEEEIKVQIQVRVLSDQLERLRRGAP